VTDNGPGFDTDSLGKVFDPYVTSKEKGTGLGLAIVRKIIEEHGGIIWAGNLEEGGGQVVFRLPTLADPADRAACEQLSRPKKNKPERSNPA
jgi:nitrogen fixation/metabolism regulation signal transduction histidine kinase